MRLSIVLLTTIMTVIGPSYAEACCWKRWWYGTTTTPYVVGYAPVAAVPATTPVATVPAAAPVAAVPATAPVAAVPTTTSVLQPTTTMAAPALTSGAYQAQRPTYYDNPSVYTGMPVASGYSALRVPVASGYRGGLRASRNVTATNLYPDTYVSAQVPVTAAPGLPLSVATPTGVPTTALPATQVAPLFPPTPPAQGGVSRFFGSQLGTSYSSAYTRAPVTYYRPMTTVDPTTGTTVTVQRPCTSYAQQVQRTPYSSLQGHSAAPPQPAPGCSTPGCGNTYGAAPAPSPYPTPLTGGIGQASATAPATQGQYAVPIPSTAPPATAPGTTYGQGGYAPNTAPLNGAPPSATAGGAQPAPRGAEDSAPLNQPELRNRPQSNGNGNGNDEPKDSEADESDRPKTESYWRLQNAQDSTAMIRSQPSAQRPAEPIHAPDDYVSPYQRRYESPASTDRFEDFDAPELPSRSFDSADPSYDANWVSTPVREASVSTRPSYRRTPRPIERDTTWTPARK